MALCFFGSANLELSKDKWPTVYKSYFSFSLFFYTIVSVYFMWNCGAGFLHRFVGGTCGTQPFSGSHNQTKLGLEAFFLSRLLFTAAGFNTRYGATRVATKMSQNLEALFRDFQAKTEYLKCSHEAARFSSSTREELSQRITDQFVQGFGQVCLDASRAGQLCSLIQTSPFSDTQRNLVLLNSDPKMGRL